MRLWTEGDRGLNTQDNDKGTENTWGKQVRQIRHEETREAKTKHTEHGT